MSTSGATPKVCGSAKVAGQQCYDDADCEFTGAVDTRCVRYDPTNMTYKQCWNGNLRIIMSGEPCFDPSLSSSAAIFCLPGYECTSTESGFRCTSTNFPTSTPTLTASPTPSPIGGDGDPCVVDRDCGANLYCVGSVCTPVNSGGTPTGAPTLTFNNHKRNMSLPPIILAITYTITTFVATVIIILRDRFSIDHENNILRIA